LQAEFEKQSGHTIALKNDTVGALSKRIEGGEVFDVAILTPAALKALTSSGKIAPESAARLARVGVGVMIKEGSALPEISTVDLFKKALLNAKSVAYIDPASGGSSGIYVAKLLESLGIAEQIKPKSVLIKGGYVAEHVARGEAELGIHQISEILPVAGVKLVGPLPKEIQNYTVYAAGLGANSSVSAAAGEFVKFLAGPQAAKVLQAKGMEPPGP
jgi:molybdate transport system substrate-binding protein